MKKKNGFTLIELLAVIVILAIIALIATPIILGIIEDTKRDSFLRSVELVVSATDLDVMNKLTDKGYEYQIVDGQISDSVTELYNSLNKEKCNAIPHWDFLTSLRIDTTTFCDNTQHEMFYGKTLVEHAKTYFLWEKMLKNYDALEITTTYKDLKLTKNTEKMNGFIQYNGEGKEIYAIHNETYCVIKTVGRKAEISTYEEGKCGLSFEDSLTQVANEGDKIISGDGQLINLGKYGIRFQGNNPNNYVIFNNELWRIIGVVDGNIKIVRGTSLESMSFDDPGNDYDASNPTTWDGNNNWTDATLQIYLNGNYYNEIDSTYKEMIQESTWYLRGHNTPAVTKYEMYDLERTTGTILYETESIEKNIGLMYASDWALGSIETDSCLATNLMNNYEDCMNSNWLASELSEWLIFPRTTHSSSAFYVDFLFSYGVTYTSADFSLGARPSLYVMPNVMFGEGIGTRENPYKLSQQQD